MAAQTVYARLFLLMLPSFFLLMSTFHLLWFFQQRSDIWWTPQTMLVPLAESNDRMEIYARGMPLRDLLDAGSIRITAESGSSLLTPSEVGVRFNNWDRVRAERIPLLLGYAATAGAAAAFVLSALLVGLGPLKPLASRPGGGTLPS